MRMELVRAHLLVRVLAPRLSLQHLGQRETRKIFSLPKSRDTDVTNIADSEFIVSNK